LGGFNIVGSFTLVYRNSFNARLNTRFNALRRLVEVRGDVEGLPRTPLARQRFVSRSRRQQLA
jgi:hypothetical protein